AIEKVFVEVTGGIKQTLADAVGEWLKYSGAVTSSGNVTLTGVTVVDPLTGQDISGVTLAPNESQTYNTSYTLTQGDLDGAGHARSEEGRVGKETGDSDRTGP